MNTKMIHAVFYKTEFTHWGHYSILNNSNKIRHALTVLKFGKSPTAELVSMGKDIKGLLSNEGCIIRVGVRTTAGNVLLWHVLPAGEERK